MEATRIATFIVWSLDVWGHIPSQCCTSYGCKCAHQDEDGNEEHDDDNCQCSTEVNDRSNVGTLEVTETLVTYNQGTEHEFSSYSASDETIIDALIAQDCLKEEARGKVEFDGQGYDNDYFLESSEGYPLFQLERTESNT